MIIYSVSVTVSESIENEWRQWMTDVHIPDLLQTGCFLEAHFCKLLDATEHEATYVIQYHCRSPADYERYRDNFAPALQKDHTDRFAGRFRASRQLLEEVVSFGLSQA